MLNTLTPHMAVKTKYIKSLRVVSYFHSIHVHVRSQQKVRKVKLCCAQNVEA